MFGQVFWLLLIAAQLQRRRFFTQQAWQPAAQQRSALTIATGVALCGPAARQQPTRSVQRELAPTGVLQFFQKLLVGGTAYIGIFLPGLNQRSPVFQQGVQRGTQLRGRGPWGGLAKAAGQGTQLGEHLDPVLQQTPVTVETVLLGQTLAAAQQVPGQRGVGFVERSFCIQCGCWQAQRVAAGIKQAITALCLADIARHQRQRCSQLGGQFQQRGRFAFAQLKLQLADFFLLLACNHLAQVQRGFDHHFGLATTPGNFGLFTDEIGGEQRLDGFLVQPGQLLGPAIAFELFQVELGFAQVPVVFIALGQAGNTLPARLHGLDDLIAIATDAQGDFGLCQLALWGIEILIRQFKALPATLVALLEQRMFAQCSEGLAADAEFDFCFFLHGRGNPNADTDKRERSP
ncbi:Uncharacterized protein AC504_2922 [Pseudomonas syringae pv. maculicola]|nr:Uncharacterized protein AC504_2922 [Pseudomonas syringae pv. maculicola]